MENPEEYIARRKGRVMAQTLELFEEELEPLLPKAAAASFKAAVRRKLNGFASDMVTLITNPGEALNGVAQDLHDRLEPDGPQQTRSS